MLPHAILRQFGVYIHPRLLTVAQCLAWRNRLAGMQGHPGPITKNGVPVLDQDARRVLDFVVTPAEMESLADDIAVVRPPLERHFQKSLGPLREARCMRYGAGDFFMPHRDAEKPDGEELYDVHRRVVSIIVFLNAPDDPVVPYEGGDLTFYGLLDVPDSDQYGLSLRAEQGMLVAFHSSTVHGVSPISTGNRYVIVGMFHDQP